MDTLYKPVASSCDRRDATLKYKTAKYNVLMILLLLLHCVYTQTSTDFKACYNDSDS